VDKALERLVWRRAQSRCEYCHLPQSLSALPFQIDHVIAIKHGGASRADNLALSCYYCNTHKGPNIAGIDSETREIVRLFHPRRDRWDAHFAWAGAGLKGLTAIGRSTIAVLAINRQEYVALRSVLIDEGVFPTRTRRRRGARSR